MKNWILPAALILSQAPALHAAIPMRGRVLTAVNANNYPAGLCPQKPGDWRDGVMRAQDPAWDNLGTIDPVNRQQLFLTRHQTALELSRATHQLPDLDSLDNGRGFLKAYREFETLIPEGYALYHSFSDPDTGVKSSIYEPMNPDQEWVIVFAGTQSLLDWAGNFDLGYRQLGRVVQNMDLFLNCQYQDDSRVPLVSRRWMVVGHSLGGGLAQGFSYEIQRHRRELGLTPLDMKLVTFNAFGGRNLIAKYHAVDDTLIDSLQAINYFVNSDPVSRLGEHLGPSFELTPSGEKFGRLNGRVTGYLSRHYLSKIFEVGLGGAQPGTPVYLDPKNEILPWGEIFRFLPPSFARIREGRLEIMLIDIARSLDQEDPNKEMRGIRRYLSEITSIWATKIKARDGENLAVRGLQDLSRRFLATK